MANRTLLILFDKKLADDFFGLCLLASGMVHDTIFLKELTNSNRSMQQLGATFGELLIPPPTPNEPYPPLPLEVDDEYIYVDHVDPQPSGIISKLAGFNLNIRIYSTLTPLTTMEMAYGIDEVFDYHRQKRVLGECLSAVKRVLDLAPNELMLQPGSQPGEFSPPAERAYFPPMPEYPGIRANGNDMLPWPSTNPDARRKLQYEIQKANIYASQLGTRSYIVEKYWNLQDAYNNLKDDMKISSPGLVASGLDGILPKAPTSNSDSIESMVVNERENIVKDLLRVLGSISQVNMEPNGGSFVSSSNLLCIKHQANCYRSTKSARLHPHYLIHHKTERGL